MACKYSDASSLACIVCDRREGEGALLYGLPGGSSSLQQRLGVDKLVS